MKDPKSVVFRSEFRKGTTKVFTNSEAKAINRNLADPVLIREAARAAFFDVKGINAMKLDPA